MARLATGFRACLEHVLGGARGSLPEAPGEAATFRFWEQWLAQQHLGLVPVTEPDRFEWAGHWIAVVRDDTHREHAVVMFGLPSGPVLDPEGATGRPFAIVAGFVVAPLGASFLREPVVPGASLAGTVAAVLIAPEAERPLVRVESARAIQGRGLEGDRYALRRGTFGRAGGTGYDLTLIEAEALERLSADAGIDLAWEDARRNVVTRGIDLAALVGRRFRVGETECLGQRLAEPCAHLERLTRPGVLRGLVHRGGLRADVLAGGTIAVGDDVVGR